MLVHHFLPIVDSYRHLGGILTANNSPAADINFRASQAMAMLRPLRRRLFGSQGVPLTIRCTLLRSLVVSRFVFACATIDLHAAQHRRRWCSQYVEQWRALCKRQWGDKPAHSYSVLHHAGATSPLLALAQARASFLTRLIRYGPSELLHLLHVHWHSKPTASWLHQLTQDLRAVAPYSTSASFILQSDNPVRAFLDAFCQEPGWWRAQLRKAVRGFADDLREWSLRPSASSSDLTDPEPVKLFQCRWCPATFSVHKHVAVHEARRHGAYSPSRHFAYTNWCLSCMGFYHTPERVQYHLRQNHNCLRRCALVIPPLPLTAVREIEDASKARANKLRQGKWQAFTAAAPATVTLGPRLPTYLEATSALSEQELTLGRIRQLYRPTPAILEWVETTCERYLPEGPRAEPTDFWTRRPSG